CVQALETEIKNFNSCFSALDVFAGALESSAPKFLITAFIVRSDDSLRSGRLRRRGRCIRRGSLYGSGDRSTARHNDFALRRLLPLALLPRNFSKGLAETIQSKCQNE